MAERRFPWRTRTYVVRWHEAAMEPPIREFLIEWGEHPDPEHDVSWRWGQTKSGGEDRSRVLVRIQPRELPERHNGRVPREVLVRLHAEAARRLRLGEKPSEVLAAMAPECDQDE